MAKRLKNPLTLHATHRSSGPIWTNMNRTRTVTRPTSTTSSVIGVPIFSLAVRSASRTSTWASLEFECGPIRGFETGSLARFDCNGSAMRKDRSHCLSDAELKVRIRLPPAKSLQTIGSAAAEPINAARYHQRHASSARWVGSSQSTCQQRTPRLGFFLGDLAIKAFFSAV